MACYMLKRQQSTNKMSVFSFVFVSALFAVGLGSCRFRESVFIRRFDLSNFVYAANLAFQFSARSKLDCAQRCAATCSCVSFTYPQPAPMQTPGVCRGHSTRELSSHDQIPSEGTVTFVSGKVVVADNVAVNKPASQISTLPGYNAGLANDGSFSDYDVKNRICSHTIEPAIAGVRNWWQVDLEACYAISSVVITTRGDCCAERLHDFDVDVYDKDPEMYPDATAQRCYHYVGSMPTGATEELVCENRPICGHVVRVTNAPGEALTLCEVQVMAVP